MNIAPSIGRLTFLGVGILSAIVMVVAAVKTGTVGFAISGIGVALLGVVAYLGASPLLQPIGKRFLKVEAADPRAVVLAAVGVVLIAAGVVLRWVG